MQILTLIFFKLTQVLVFVFFSTTPSWLILSKKIISPTDKSLCKFLGDTSHIVMAYILLHEIKNNKLDELKINLQLSERPMLIRNCLPDDNVLENFGIKEENLRSLIILMKKTAIINKLKEESSSSSDTDIKFVGHIQVTLIILLN